MKAEPRRIALGEGDDGCAGVDEELDPPSGAAEQAGCRSRWQTAREANRKTSSDLPARVPSRRVAPDATRRAGLRPPVAADAVVGEAVPGHILGPVDVAQVHHEGAGHN